MTAKKFSIGLLGTTLISVICFFVFQALIPDFSYMDLLFYSIGLFVFISILFYFLGARAANSTNKNSFLSIIVYNIFLKIILSFLLIFVYTKFNEPNSKLFIIPFFIVYLFFTIFETYFLSQQSRQTK